MKIVGVFLALPLAFFAWMYWGTVRTERELRPVASAVAGHPVKVDCQGFLSSLVDIQDRPGLDRFECCHEVAFAGDVDVEALPLRGAGVSLRLEPQCVLHRQRHV